LLPDYPAFARQLVRDGTSFAERAHPGRPGGSGRKRIGRASFHAGRARAPRRFSRVADEGDAGESATLRGAARAQARHSTLTRVLAPVFSERTATGAIARALRNRAHRRRRAGRTPSSSRCTLACRAARRTAGQSPVARSRFLTIRRTSAVSPTTSSAMRLRGLAAARAAPRNGENLLAARPLDAYGGSTVVANVAVAATSPRITARLRANAGMLATVHRSSNRGCRSGRPAKACNGGRVPPTCKPKEQA
jgi:hypothetical protein